MPTIKMAMRIGGMTWFGVLIVLFATHMVASRQRALQRENAQAAIPRTLPPILVTTGQRTDSLFKAGYSDAVMIVSSNCEACLKSKGLLVALLQSLEVDRRWLIVDSELARLSFGAVNAAVPVRTALLAEPNAFRRINVRQVPTLIVSNRDSEALDVRVGVPSRRARRQFGIARRK